MTPTELRRKADQWDKVAGRCKDPGRAARYQVLARQARIRAAVQEHGLSDDAPPQRSELARPIRDVNLSGKRRLA